MRYQQLLTELENQADANYRVFHKKLLKNDNINVIGVRVPQLRKIAKKYSGDVEELLTFPDEYYEVTFVKLTAVSNLNYNDYIKYLDKCVPLINNWATCDCFIANCIKDHREDFLQYIHKYAGAHGEYFQRFALVTLLHFYTEEKYAQLIFQIVENCDTSLYYVHMAAAWLVAEMLVKNYEPTRVFLLKNSLDKKTHNKAIQKACESFRLSDERKNYLKEIKR